MLLGFSPRPNRKPTVPASSPATEGNRAYRERRHGRALSFPGNAGIVTPNEADGHIQPYQGL